MAKQPAAKQQTANKPAGTQTKSSPPSGATRGTRATSERDENYDLISVLYHALKGAETAGQYLEDAQTSGDEELTDFLEETRDEYNDRAREARELLARRLGASASGEEEEEEDEDEDEEDEEDED